MCRFLPDWSDMKIHIICYVTANFQMWEKSGPWGMDQNASWHHAPWTMGKNLIKPPEFFMVMSIFLKWMAGSNGRGRWQGGVIDSSLTFSFFQNFLLSTIAKKSTNIEKEFFILGSISIYMPAFILIYLLFLFCLFFILEITLFFIFETWKISTVQIESIFHGEILKNLNIIYEDIFIWN